jgi:hypothetical protein
VNLTVGKFTPFPTTPVPCALCGKTLAVGDRMTMGDLEGAWLCADAHLLYNGPIPGMIRLGDQGLQLYWSVNHPGIHTPWCVECRPKEAATTIVGFGDSPVTALDDLRNSYQRLLDFLET